MPNHINNIDQTYKYWRIRILYSMYFGYAFYYFTRKSFVFLLPAVINDLHFDKIQIGMLGSIFYITYGLSKFVNGLWSDRVNPRYVMSFGLIISGIINIIFGFSSSLIFLALLWFLNGFFQGFGWPPCAKLLTHWYSQNERGVWWGIWNTSQTLGSTAVPLIAGGIATYLSWRYGMHFFGIVTILAGFFLLNRLNDVPEKFGLPPVEEYRNDYPSEKKFNYKTKLSTKEIFFKYVLKNKYIWILASAYFLIYVVRITITDWGSIYLTGKGLSLMSANSCMATLEVGGFAGSLACGWLSDRLFHGKRNPVSALFCLGVILSLLPLIFLHQTSMPIYLICSFLAGFFIFGPQMLIGIAAAELSHREAAGTSTGFIAIFAYLGAAFSGLPIGYIIQHWDWSTLLAIILACCLLIGTILSSLWSLKTTWE